MFGLCDYDFAKSETENLDKKTLALIAKQLENIK
jgi:hypothetical protein